MDLTWDTARFFLAMGLYGCSMCDKHFQNVCGSFCFNFLPTENSRRVLDRKDARFASTTDLTEILDEMITDASKLNTEEQLH